MQTRAGSGRKSEKRVGLEPVLAARRTSTIAWGGARRAPYEGARIGSTPTPSTRIHPLPARVGSLGRSCYATQDVRDRSGASAPGRSQPPAPSESCWRSASAGSAGSARPTGLGELRSLALAGGRVFHVKTLLWCRQALGSTPGGSTLLRAGAGEYPEGCAPWQCERPSRPRPAASPRVHDGSPDARTGAEGQTSWARVLPVQPPFRACLSRTPARSAQPHDAPSSLRRDEASVPRETPSSVLAPRRGQCST